MQSTDSARDLASPVWPAAQKILTDFLQQRRDWLLDVSPELSHFADTATSLLAGGKRLRPVLCYWGWRAACPTGHEDTVVTAAAALELFHTAALVHDDITDNSDTRRGELTVHQRFTSEHRRHGWSGDAEAFGRSCALLLGDALFTWSDDLFSTIELPPHTKHELRAVFERMRTEIVGGQFLDGLGQVDSTPSPHEQEERARRVIRYKTARYSVEHPLVMGGIIAGASGDQLATYRAYATSLGEAYQLRDDILGVFGDPAITGKPAGDDLREGKSTVLIAYALEHATPAQRHTISDSLGNPALDQHGIDQMRAILIETKAHARVEARIADLAEQSHLALENAPLNEEGRAALTRLITLATSRIR